MVCPGVSGTSRSTRWPRAGSGGAHDGHGGRGRSLAGSDRDRRRRARARDADQSVRRRHLSCHAWGRRSRSTGAYQAPAPARARHALAPPCRCSCRGVVSAIGWWRVPAARWSSGVATHRCTRRSDPAVVRPGAAAGGGGCGWAPRAGCGRSCPRPSLAVLLLLYYVRPAERRSRVVLSGRPDAAHGARGDGRSLVQRGRSARLQRLIVIAGALAACGRADHRDRRLQRARHRQRAPGLGSTGRSCCRGTSKAPSPGSVSTRRGPWSSRWTHGAAARFLEPDSLVRPARHGGGSADLAAEDPGIRSPLRGGQVDLQLRGPEGSHARSELDAHQLSPSWM